MKVINASIFTIILSLSVFSQNTNQPLATASGRSFTAQDLSPKVAEAWIKLPQTLANARTKLLEQQIERTLLDIEATSQKLSVQKLIEKDVNNKVPDPSAEEVKKLYEANRANIGNTPFEKVRSQIIQYLRSQPEQKAYAGYIETLKKKNKITLVKNVNSNNLLSADVLAKVGEQEITYAQFFKRNGLELYEYEANIFDAMKISLEQVVDSATYASEAQGLGIATSQYIAREITDKLKTYTNEETQRIQTNLRKKLYPKYRVKYFLNEPKPYIQRIAADDDPFIGKANAPVTVVMFTDYQCPGCASVYPILKQIINGYGDKVRLVIRDFPLEQIHENAFQAAIAANAANKQGKFFEFKELLYKKQEALDTESLKKYATQVGLNLKKFEKDLNDKAFTEEVRKDIIDGRKYGVKGTPSVFVNGYKIRSLSSANFSKAIERALKK